MAGRKAVRSGRPAPVLPLLRRLAGDRRGGPVVEFALAAPIVFMFIFGLIQLGYAMWLQNSLDYSVAVAARCASLNGSACSGQVTSYAADQSGANINAADFTYTCRASDSCANKTATCGCQVSAHHYLPLDIPWLSLSVNLSASSCIAPPPNLNCAS